MGAWLRTRRMGVRISPWAPCPRSSMEERWRAKPGLLEVRVLPGTPSTLRSGLDPGSVSYADAQQVRFLPPQPCGDSSAGRAPVLQTGARRFDPGSPYQLRERSPIGRGARLKPGSVPVRARPLAPRPRSPTGRGIGLRIRPVEVQILPWALTSFVALASIRGLSVAAAHSTTANPPVGTKISLAT